MTNEVKRVQVPFFYNPYDYQRKAWERRRTGKYNYYIKIGCRQSGKDTDDLQYLLNTTGRNPGTNNAYVGLNNKGVRENIFFKDVDRRRHGDDYPKDIIDPKPSEMVVFFNNNTEEFNAEGLAPGRIKFIGYHDDDSLVGNSYYNGVISEAGLYGPHAGDKMKPVWNRKKASGQEFLVSINGTPRGIKNSYYELISELTGKTDPEDFPGEHKSEKGLVYVDMKKANELYIPDINNPEKKVRLFSDELLDELRQDCIRQYGNDNLFQQEYMCKFTTVNAGLVYQAIEVLHKEGRYCKFNLEDSKPLYMAGDIASKTKQTDMSAYIVFQVINGCFRAYDCGEMRGKSLVECVTELSRKPYFHRIRVAGLPGDAERSASSATPKEECEKVYPNIYWHTLDREFVYRGITEARRMLANAMIHNQNCKLLFDALSSFSYKGNEKLNTGSDKPIHDRGSHLADCFRYCAMLINEMKYLGLNDDGSQLAQPLFYGDLDNGMNDLLGVGLSGQQTSIYDPVRINLNKQQDSYLDRKKVQG